MAHDKTHKPDIGDFKKPERDAGPASETPAPDFQRGKGGGVFEKSRVSGSRAAQSNEEPHPGAPAPDDPPTYAANPLPRMDKHLKEKALKPTED